MSAQCRLSGEWDAWIATQANLHRRLSAQRGRSHNPRIIESRMQGYIA
jgi:hypothetical protein